MNYYYRLYELNIATTFPCDILPPAPAGAEMDVFLCEGHVPRRLENPIISEAGWDASPGLFLLRGGRSAGRFLVQGGTRITLERNPGAEDVVLAVCFTSAVIPVLLQQRGMLVLHANTAVTPKGAVAVSGLSGAGKTTTVAALLEQGCQLLADDITILRPAADGYLEVIPGAPQLHLCEDTAGIFGYDISTLPRYPWRRMKAAVPVHSIMAEAPARLERIYLLTFNASGGLEFSAVSGVEKFAAFQDCLYGPVLPAESASFFTLHTAMIASIEIIRIARPADCWTLQEIVTGILHG